MKHEFLIRDILIKPNLILAPMAGVTDCGFRNLIKGLGGVGLIVTEFISVEGLTRGNLKTHKMMKFAEQERPISIQFFGHNPERMAIAAQIAEEAGADIVDVNCGCPARKVIHRGAGSSLLKDLSQLEKILKTMRAVIKIPLTLKIRIGWDSESIVAVDVAKLAVDCGVEAIAVHGRTRVQGYSGAADWDVINAVSNAVNIPVVGSGDVTTVENALQRLQKTAVSGVMIGRGAMANPWIFRQISETMDGKTPYKPTLFDKKKLLLEYFDVMLTELSHETAAMGKVKQLCAQFTKGLPGGAIFRQKIFHSQSKLELVERIESYFCEVNDMELKGNLCLTNEDDLMLCDEKEEFICQD